GPAAGITVSGNQQSRVFEVGDGTHQPNVAIARLTVSQGQTTSSGGGVLVNAGSSLTLVNCTLNGNSATNNGRGPFLVRATVLLAFCTLSGNYAGANGGGLSDVQGSVTLANCTLAGNSAFQDGGGLFNGQGTATLIDCTLAGNSAHDGGGLDNFQGTA